MESETIFVFIMLSLFQIVTLLILFYRLVSVKRQHKENVDVALNLENIVEI